MMRLAVHGENADWPAVAARLRGGSIACTLETADTPLPSETSYDALLLLAPNLSHTKTIEQALTQGKHVLLAGPTPLSSAVLEAFSKTSQQVRKNQATGQFSIVNPDHFLPSRQLLHQQLIAGKLGQPGLIRMHRWEANATPLNATSPSLPTTLVLDLELATWILGALPNVVYATEAPQSGSSSKGRTIQVHLGFEGGPMALIGYSSALPSGDDYRTLSVMGSAGAAYADDHQNMQLLYRGHHPQAIRAEEKIRPLVNLVQDFVDALQTSRDLSSGVANWLRALTIAQAVEHSLASRQAISPEFS
ncbi:MAG: hypothetical protein V4719_05455 [Planctomycetota bacterium]